MNVTSATTIAKYKSSPHHHLLTPQLLCLASVTGNAQIPWFDGACVIASSNYWENRSKPSNRK